VCSISGPIGQCAQLRLRWPLDLAGLFTSRTLIHVEDGSDESTRLVKGGIVRPFLSRIGTGERAASSADLINRCSEHFLRRLVNGALLGEPSF